MARHVAGGGALAGMLPAPQARLAVWLVDLVAARTLLGDPSFRDAVELPDAMAERLGTGTPRDIAHIMLRIILTACVGRSAAFRPFLHAPGGKPALDLAPSTPRLEFSLAHCDSAAIVALSREGPVGVDLEAPRSVRISGRRRAMLIDAASSLAPDDPLPDGPDEARFLQAWVRLEALAKATGEGLGALLGRLDDEAAPIAATRLEGALVRTRDLRIPAGPPLYAAVAGTGPSLQGEVLSAVWLPCDPDWLRRWIAVPADR